jgi:hypothetical protein
MSQIGERLFVSDTTISVVAEGFGDGFWESELGSERGETKLVKEKNEVIHEGVVPALLPNQPMELSIWIKMDIESNYLPGLVVQQFEGENAVSWDWIDMKNTTDVLGHWARVEIPFTLQKAGNRIKVFCDGENLTFDNLLVKPRGTDVYYQSSSSLVLNNYSLD